MKDFVKTVKALSDPNRVRIIKLLQKGEMNVGQIKDALGMAQSTTSKHLKILLEAGFVTYSKEGLWVKYRLARETANCYASCLLGNLRHWLEPDVKRLETPIGY